MNSLFNPFIINYYIFTPPIPTGSKEQTGEDGRPEFLLVVSFSPLGCLQDYLRGNTFDWNNLCKMILSIARGLAHLHSELRKGGTHTEKVPFKMQ